ncbi:S49 family peptidase [Oceanicaulis alexandrii]|uniref:S49 family peptidase n=1 Tax=Oceanicaulis alexandrii TaxID=153233 RepID=UPI0003B3C957|nr:S49 family peptidase [Oceanicaulis alexandrii]
MKQFWLTFFGSIAGVIAGAILCIVFVIFLIGGLIGAALETAARSDAPPLTGNAMVLELDLRTPRLDQPSASPFAFAEPLSIVELSQALERARTDSRVAAVFVRANTLSLPAAQAEQIHTLLARISDAGKPVIAHAQGFEGGSVLPYFAVGGADEIWMQDSASFTAVGLSVETLFLGGMFEQFGVQPQFVQFHEFKNAADTFTRTGYTDAHREATLSWLGSIHDTALAALARSRDIEPERLRALVEAGPYSAEQALDLGLVDRLGHVAAARQSVLDRAGPNARIVDIALYHKGPVSPPPSQAPVIALVEAQGGIVTGASEAGLGSGPLVGGDTLADAIDAAASDSAVRAIILRIDSPGGSAIASDQIWDAVMRARQAGKPVIASMGATAASGGYYIAAPADRIIAQATTLTGSIGMYGGKLVADEALGRLGLNLDPLHVGGEYALAQSAAQPWTETQAADFARLAEDVYEDFTLKVAEGRDLPLARIQQIARGRVWTGAQALELGLVDELGGFDAALASARAMAGLSDSQRIRLQRFPARPEGLEALQALFGVSLDTVHSAQVLNQLLETPEAQALLRQQARLRAEGADLTAPAEQPR